MTTDEALERLRPDWSISKAEDYETDEPGWAVYSLMNGEHYERLGWGRTPIEAIETAVVKVEQDEREAAERRADYERRKAAGQLTPLEQLNDRIGAMWSGELLKVVQTPTLFSSLVDRSYEGDVKTGDTISIRRYRYIAMDGGDG